MRLSRQLPPARRVTPEVITSTVVEDTRDTGGAATTAAHAPPSLAANQLAVTVSSEIYLTAFPGRSAVYGIVVERCGSPVSTKVAAVVFTDDVALMARDQSFGCGCFDCPRFAQVSGCVFTAFDSELSRTAVRGDSLGACYVKMVRREVDVRQS
ncbi:hypothetical protein D4764_22G0001930 [Takifugu flavidus]|uniref:Uncharacterized protein n=1 Tax=Takifugu flavidus TaxID=433684 RepID=A0A5C6NBH7_9TELE|nr:hypothetical protein D4764_22G0001930 [Takifugu flavidus]